MLPFLILLFCSSPETARMILIYATDESAARLQALEDFARLNDSGLLLPPKPHMSGRILTVTSSLLSRYTRFHPAIYLLSAVCSGMTMPHIPTSTLLPVYWRTADVSR
jgi:hypothetical protein